LDAVATEASLRELNEVVRAIPGLIGYPLRAVLRHLTDLGEFLACNHAYSL
jgi:hypothetical protein